VGRVADEVGPAVSQEHGWRPFGNAQAGGQLVLVLGLQVTGVEGDGEVGPATDLVDLVHRFVRPLLEARRRRDRQVAAGREPDNADPVGVDSPLFGLAPNQAYGPLGVLKGPAARLAFG